MIYYFIIVALLAAFLLQQYCYYNRLFHSHNAQVRLRELRFDALIYLSDNVRVLPNESVDEVSRLVRYTNGCLSHFETFAHHMGRFKVFKAYVGIAVFTREQLMAEHVCKTNATIESFNARFSQSIKDLFLIIPLFRVRAVFYLAQLVAKLLVRLGFDKCKKWVEQLARVETALWDTNNHQLC